MTKLRFFLLLAVVLSVALYLWQVRAVDRSWTPSDVEMLQSLSLDALPALTADPSNAVADNRDAALFGAMLFHDARLSADGSVSCATCHQSQRRFTDGLVKGKGLGESGRNTPSIIGTAYSPWLYWDGRRDSQWSQALSPLEDVNEHGTTRQAVLGMVVGDQGYRERYTSLFGELPDPQFDDAEQVNAAFANLGKVIAAFERTLLPTSSRFDQYVTALVDGDGEAQVELFSNDEVAGLRLFIGEAECTQCHNGPLFTNNEFHNTGVISLSGEVPDRGRVVGVDGAFDDPFNCLGKYSDDSSRTCPELEFALRGIELLGAMRTPSLRNLAGTEPYMHKGQLATLADVLEHYNNAPEAMIGHSELQALNLSARELKQLEAFLQTLDAPVGGVSF